MRRGEVWWVDFEPSFGHETNKVRPAVIVSQDDLNLTSERLGRGLVTVVPLTSSLARTWDFQVILPADETGLDRDARAQPEQIRALDIRRLRYRVGMLPAALAWELDEAIALHLALN